MVRCTKCGKDVLVLVTRVQIEHRVYECNACESCAKKFRQRKGVSYARDLDIMGDKGW